MTNRLFALLFTGLALSATACGSETSAPEASEDATTAKATVLSISSPADVAAEFETLFERELGYSLDRDPAKIITEKWIGEHLNVELAGIVREILVELGKVSAAPSTLKTGAGAWAEKKLAPFVDASGKIPSSAGAKIEALSSNLGLALDTSNRVNAWQNAEDPAGIDLETLPTLWSGVKKFSTLDRNLYTPVHFDKAPSLTDLRRELVGQELSFVSWGHDAISDFWATSEGPENDPAFKPLADLLNKSSIRARYYFAGSDNGRGDFGWSSHVLIVVDEHNQAYGFQMGYSE